MGPAPRVGRWLRLLVAVTFYVGAIAGVGGLLLVWVDLGLPGAPLVLAVPVFLWFGGWALLAPVGIPVAYLYLRRYGVPGRFAPWERAAVVAWSVLLLGGSLVASAIVGNDRLADLFAARAFLPAHGIAAVALTLIALWKRSRLVGIWAVCLFVQAVGDGLTGWRHHPTWFWLGTAVTGLMLGHAARGSPLSPQKAKDAALPSDVPMSTSG